jgi:ribosome biogenesis protein BRX1
LEDPRAAAAIESSVRRDLKAAREQEKEDEILPPEEEPEDAEEGAVNGEDQQQAPEKPDPYLLADATYIQKDTRWRNKQRTLVMCTRGVTARYRHLAEDIKKLLPHHKPEPKFEKKNTKFYELNEICELKSCNNCLFFEARKHKHLYMWLARVPSGPTLKFQVLNIHTTGEVRLAGNCLLGSRPILQFDKAFDGTPFLRLVKEMFIQALGTPRNHPKSKPFHDHIMSFYILDNKIWFRHYQISPELPADMNDPEKQQLTEIGPRFVLDPVRALAGSFCGQTIYSNNMFLTPTAQRIQTKKALQSPYVAKLQHRMERKQKIEDLKLPEDPMDEVFI